MSKSQASAAPVVAPAIATPVVKNIMAGAIFDRLSAVGACIVALGSKGMLHDKITSKLPSALPVAEVGARTKELAKAAGWDAFNFGYLIGERSSYSACAAAAGQKKAKANPAFVWAAKDDKGVVSLYTSTGNLWVRPSAAGRLQEQYDAAHASAVKALTPEVEAKK